MAFSLKKIAVLVAAPVFLFLYSAGSRLGLLSTGLFADRGALSGIFYFLYIVYLTLLQGFSTMSVIRFENSLELLWHLYKKTVPQAVFYLLYVTAWELIFSLAMRYPFNTMLVLKYLAVNLAALLVINLLGTAAGIRFGPIAAKGSVTAFVLCMILFETLKTVFDGGADGFFTYACITDYPDIGTPDALVFIKMLTALITYTTLMLAVYIFVKKDMPVTRHE